MNATHRQGLFFVAVALWVSTYHVTFGLPGDNRLLPLLAGFIVLVGIPHGALDTMLAGRMFPMRKPLQWALFSTTYLGLVLLVMAAWQLWPVLLLLLFLIVSAGHFAGDPEAGCPVWIRFAYGCAPVVLPALFYRDEVLRLFSFLAPEAASLRLLAALSTLGWSLLVVLGVAVLVLARQHWRTALEITAVTTLFVVTPPLTAFTVFFCGMHSARHILRCLRDETADAATGEVLANNHSKVGKATILQAVRTGLPPMLATLALLAVYWANAATFAFESRLVQTVFIGLAALTFPHVILVDGLSRWRPTG
ncbi:MAG: Brp/Blh family beta-carotene 15,15'-dioxygenase [Bryobacterales bacterium]|jgi:Brp/Blh family beta-carotene 15,15'-monooxygenase|nr:Brp/Blh family beta-carotene 15,15'-dioxygenase [Bryobacterales bacterium]